MSSHSLRGAWGWTDGGYSNRDPETPKEDLGEQEPGTIPESVVPSIMPEGLGTTFCKSGFGFCGSRGIIPYGSYAS